MREADPVAGVFWMLVTGGCFVAVTAIVKHVGSTVPPAEAAFLRYLIGLVFVLPLIGRIGDVLRDRAMLRLFALRGAVHTVAVALWFYAMTQIPIAEVTAMNYLTPVYVTVGAALFLGERLAFRRIGAILAALIGVLMIIRPGFREVEPGHLAMLVVALLFSVSYLTAKRASDSVSPGIVVAMLSLFVTVGLFPFAFAVWVPPTMGEVGWLALVAGFATAGHYTMTLAFRAAPVTVTQPVTFLQLVWAALLGWALFDEALDPYVLAGGTMIVAAVTLIAWRESVLGRRPGASGRAGRITASEPPGP